MAKPLAPTPAGPIPHAQMPLALTLGEPAGIGPDITIAAWLRRNELKLPPFYLLGDRACLADRAKALGVDIPLADVTAEDACRSRRLALTRPPKPAVPTTAVRRPHSPPFARPSPTSVQGAQAQSSPIRSPKACSIVRASITPVTPNFSPSLQPPVADRRNR
jgi:4-hydroxythreonine-4-phosphate dehydrogenase